MIQLTVNSNGLEQVLAPLGNMHKIITKVVMSALKRAGKSLQRDVQRGIRKESYLKSSDVRMSMSPLIVSTTAPIFEAVFHVSSKRLGADHFKMIPNRVTARKGVRSIKWARTGFKIGPSEPVRYPGPNGKYSKAFVISFQGRKMLVQRVVGKRHFTRVKAYSVQYFSVFERVKGPAMEKARETFEKRLIHEVDRCTGKMK